MDTVSAIAFKLQKCMRMTLKCVVSGIKSITIFTNDNEMEETECFVCGTSIRNRREGLNQAIEESLNAQ